MSFCDKGGAAFSSETNEWSTPQDLFEELNEEFGFTIDVAATAENAKCERYYTAADDGLKQSWGGESVFCNPPYGRQIGRWVEKAAREAEKPGTTVVLLTRPEPIPATFTISSTVAPRSGSFAAASGSPEQTGPRAARPSRPW